MITYRHKHIEKWPLSENGLFAHTHPMDIDKLIGVNLKRLRENRHISQEKLAEMINTPATRLSAYENGREGMGKDIMMRICKALSVKPYEFYIEADTPVLKNQKEFKYIDRMREAEKLHCAEEIARYAEYTIKSKKQADQEDKDSEEFQKTMENRYGWGKKGDGGNTAVPKKGKKRPGKVQKPA